MQQSPKRQGYRRDRYRAHVRTGDTFGRIMGVIRNSSVSWAFHGQLSPVHPDWAQLRVKVFMGPWSFVVGCHHRAVHLLPRQDVPLALTGRIERPRSRHPYRIRPGRPRTDDAVSPSLPVQVAAFRLRSAASGVGISPSKCRCGVSPSPGRRATRPTERRRRHSGLGSTVPECAPRG
jgi:hypothetical protein